MAIDTRNKRASCLLLAMPFGRVFPSPDGSLATQSDRQFMARLYAGLLTVIVLESTTGYPCWQSAVCGCWLLCLSPWRLM